VVFTAKVIKGARRLNDPLGRYATYTTNGRIVRRAANPENYKHSRNERVQRTREAMRRVMIRYSALDIYKRQLYTEATALDNPIVREIIKRKIINDIKPRKPKPPPINPFPTPPPNPFWTIPPWPYPTPNPNIDINVWPYPDWEPWGQHNIRPGPNSYGHDHLPNEIPNPSRDHPTPGEPGEIPLPVPGRREPTPEPVYIVVEIDPSGLTGTAYDVYLEAKSAYRSVKRWIHNHQKEVIIIVIIGLVVFFFYTFAIAGVELGTGSYVLADASLQQYAPLLIPLAGGRPIEWVKDWFYKKLVIHWAKNLNFAAINMTRGWYCYKEVEDYGTDVYYTFYEGPDKKHKGEVAAVVHLKVDLDNKTSGLSWYCGDSTDTIWVYKDDVKLFECNPEPYPMDFVYLWNSTKKCSGEARITRQGNQVIYAFEDRPRFGDGDYNDAYVVLTYDNNGNLISVEAQEGRHMDDLWVYWRQYLIAHFPGRW